MCFKKAELTRLITVLDPRTRTNVQMRLCDFVTSHTARKTFISILYEQVQDPNLIGKMSGHTEGSRAFSAASDASICRTSWKLRQPCLNRVSRQTRRVMPGRREMVSIIVFSPEIQSCNRYYIPLSPK